MALSRNHRDFPHIKEVLDKAIEYGGLRYTTASDAAAVRWRLMAYHVRKLMQKENMVGTGKNAILGPSIYDGMFITLEGATVVIRFRHNEILGDMKTLDNLPINEKTKKPEPLETNELVEVADQVKKDLGL